MLPALPVSVFPVFPVAKSCPGSLWSWRYTKIHPAPDQDQYYLRALRCRWEEFRGGVLQNDSIMETIPLPPGIHQLMISDGKDFIPLKAIVN